MGGDATFGTSYTPESLLWEQWWSSNQLVPFGSSEDKSSTANSVYTQTGPLIDSSLHGYVTDLAGHWHYIGHEMNYTNPLTGVNPISRKSTGRTPLGDRDINPQTKKKGKYSPVRRTRNTSSNGAHLAQQNSDRIERIQERNRTAANKLRVKKREEQQDLERIQRDLSTCVADLTFEVYELKMQLLQHSECNCTLM
ncbi:uncharacterized protein B0J16DRAFT_405280 [Fusarium flagelliforme]|uniref:uncharacterized protein n=1 Tax=Fusarium flagelliforme TaxID=2675880 RepID=UPI001E8D3A1C|nr:uncharacterized protein B0J16DRAFT_405280 [Fusarium flagelliforme]KAH7175160.1 hypothetical protein B0J16DRAFT_405280 [Fusarium flagelliforme]